MKRLRVDETVKEGSGSPTTGIIYHRQSAVSTTQLPLSTLSIASSLNQTLQPIEGSMQSGIYSPAAPVKYGAMPTATAAPHSAKPQTAILSGHAQLISNSSSNASSPPNQSQESPQQQQQQSPAGNFQRLKVEDALSYLDLVKFKFGSKPQVYNDFLDIMKEFKSQSIDTPGVIQRVSNLFKGFPELIVGFNTFLPPGYKIEVQKSDQGYAFQVSVSMPSPTGTLNSDPQQQRSAMIMKGSGPITVCPATVAAPPPPPPPAPPTQPPVTAIAHISPVVPPPVPVAAALAVQHHSSNFTGSAPTYGLSLAQAAVALQGNTADGPQNQPVEFNHAINYVNKIKNRFQGQPEKYKKFLEILHTYQKEQRTLKDTSSVSVLGSGKHLTEQEVYSQVAKLFENQSDLLAEFGQFLPDATSHINQAPISEHSNSVKKTPGGGKPYRGDHLLDRHISHKQSHISGPVKRSESYQNYRDAPPPKKHKLSSNRDVTLTEAGKHGTLNDYAFFDKARKAFRTSEEYNNFLRCLILFNQEVVSKSELIHIVTPFLGKFPELFKWFKDFLGQNDMVETIPYNVARSERPQGDHALEIDLATAKRLGASYCIIPKAQEGLLCSGRTQLCREVLNDQWVSFPTWSEDSTFVSSRKTQYEEYMYRCEDERFELDVVIETNASTIRVLEGVHKKISRMSQDDISKFKLDDCLGGSSPTLHQRALKRIYGDKAPDIIDGLKRNPLNAVPVVLRRLKAKEEEWREAQKGFNKIWREQNEKYYLKSLDHQGINFKQTDVKALRSKSLFNEIETLFDERHEQNELGAESITGPHLVLPYKDRTILDDASNLFIHHIKRQSGIQKGEKKRIKHLIRQYLPDLFFHPRQQLSDDEREDEDENDEDDDSPSSSPSADSNGKGKGSLSPRKSPGQNIDPETEVKNEPLDLKEDDLKVPLHAQTSYSDEAYTLFMANNHWYIFLRLHAILCERLAKIYERACTLASEEQILRSNRKESTAVALRLKPKPQIEVEDYYVAFLDMVKNLLDGNMESNTYEDTLREMFGIHAYIAFTLDKVVSYAVRQLQHCVTERTAIACTDLFLKEQKRGAAGGPCATAYKRAHAELAYQRSGEKAVQDETCFKIYIYKRASKITIELLDTEPEESKKVDDVKKWSQYKECYADCANTNNTNKSPAFLSRNLRLYKRRLTKDKRNNNEIIEHENSNSNEEDQNNRDKAREGDALDLLDLIELRNMREERAPPERNQSQHPGYDVSDDTECKFNPQDTKITYTVNKSSYMYKISAFYRARKTHPGITKYKSSRFRGWLKQWAGTNVSEVQQKQCTDWMMGRCDGVVPNRTRVLTDNDLSRSPYVPYNRYRVDRLSEDST